MRHTRRLGIAAALAAQAALMTLMTGTALAGGWAEVTMVDGAGDPPIAGEEREIRFSLLQHGVTAVDFGEAQLTAVNPDTGETITVAATNHGGGLWSAIVTFPAGGNWEIGVAHNELLTSEPTTIGGRAARHLRLAPRCARDRRIRPHGGRRAGQRAAHRSPPTLGCGAHRHAGARQLTRPARVRAPAVRSHRRGFSVSLRTHDRSRRPIPSRGGGARLVRRRARLGGGGDRHRRRLVAGAAG